MRGQRRAPLAGVGGLELQHAGVGELKTVLRQRASQFRRRKEYERDRAAVRPRPPRECRIGSCPTRGGSAGEADRPVGRPCATPGGRATAGRPWPRARLPGGPRVASGLRSCTCPPKPRRAVTIQTLFVDATAEAPAERVARTPAKTPARSARTGKEPQEPKNQTNTPNPLKGGVRTTRSRSRRATQPPVGENATGVSASTSPRSSARSV